MLIHSFLHSKIFMNLPSVFVDHKETMNRRSEEREKEVSFYVDGLEIEPWVLDLSRKQNLTGGDSWPLPPTLSYIRHSEPLIGH